MNINFLNLDLLQDPEIERERIMKDQNQNPDQLPLFQDQEAETEITKKDQENQDQEADLKKQKIFN